MPPLEARSLTSQAFDAKLGRSLRESFGPDTVAHWRLIAGSVFPSILNNDPISGLPRSLQSYFKISVPHADPEVYRRYVENFENWEEALKAMQVPLEERAELFDPVLGSIVDMRVVPKLRMVEGEIPDSDIPTRIVEISTDNLPVEIYVNGVKPIFDRLKMDYIRGIESAQNVNCTYGIQLHS